MAHGGRWQDERREWAAAFVLPLTLAVSTQLVVTLGNSDWPIFQRAADLGLDAYTYDNGFTGPMTGPLTILLAAVLPTWAAVAAIYTLLPVTLFRSGLTPRRALLAGLFAAPFWGNLADWSHLDDALAVALLLEARRHRGWRAGVLVGLAIAVKPWAIVGLPLLWGTASGFAAAAAVQVVWLPFLHDILTMARPATVVQTDSPLRAFMGMGVMPSPGWRFAELALAVAVAALCCWRGRADAAIVAGMAARMLLNPTNPDYYWGSLALAAVVMGRGRGWVFALFAVQWAISSARSPAAGPVAVSALCTLLVVAISLVRPRGAGSAEPSLSGRPRRTSSAARP